MIRKNSAARTFLCLLLAFVFAASCLPQTIFATTDKKTVTTWPEGPENNSGAVCLLDADTGAVLYDKNMDEQRYPASITKIIYHSVAQQLNSEGGNVERNMRYAVHRAWDKCDKAVLARYFGEARAQDKEPPSNREFCAALVEYLRQEACRL